MHNFIRVNVVLLLTLLLSGQVALADDAPNQVATLMQQQVDAVAANDRAAFIHNGNRAFREMMDEWTFDSIVMQHKRRLAKGYQLEYLGPIKRLGMDEYVWRVRPNDYKYQWIGRLSVANGKVVGFMLD